MKSRHFVSATAALVVVGVVGFGLVLPSLAETDYTTIPAPLGETAKKLKGVAISLSKAIEIAQTATKGVVASASVNLNGAKPSVEVLTYGEASAHKVVVDGMSGGVVSNTTMSRFPGEAVSGEWTEMPSKLKYYEIKVGTGAAPASPAAEVTVHYSGYLVDGTKFDSSVDRGTPATFPLNRVIPGWTVGVGSMKVGGKRKLIIPYELAYGAAGKRPTIPPKATLIFDVSY